MNDDGGSMLGDGREAPMRWGIIGPGAISADFAAALRSSQTGTLHAVGGRDRARAESFAHRFDAPVASTAAEIIGRDDIDAIYVGTVHTAHAEAAAAALAAGKAVLCEKPLSPHPDEARALVEAAERAERPLVEAYKYRFGALADRVRSLVASGAIGAVRRVDAAGGFAAPTREGRLFDPIVAGGAIFDMGGYPVSLAVGVAAWAGIVADAELAEVGGEVGETGVDESARAVIRLGPLDAHVATSIVEHLPRQVTITGDDGAIEIENIWGSRSRSASELTVRVDDRPERVSVEPIQPMAAEADAVARALRTRVLEVPEVPWRDTLATADLLATWRAKLG